MIQCIYHFIDLLLNVVCLKVIMMKLNFVLLQILCQGVADMISFIIFT